MDDLILSFLSAAQDQKQSALRALLGRLKKSVVTEPEETARAIRRLVSPELDYSSAEALSRIQQTLKKNNLPATVKKLAILGSFTTHQLAALIELYLFAAGISVVVYESDFGVLQQEILDPTSGMHEFKPDVLYLAPSRRSLSNRPSHSQSPTQIDEMVNQEIQGWCSLWAAAHQATGCQIIQNNIDSPPHRSLNNHEMRHHTGLARYTARINHGLQDAAPVYVTIYDVDHLAASVGRWAFGDDRFYFHAKMPCAPEFLPLYAHGVASLIGAYAGTAKKCLVLDLDNTLWGGVIGDDGLGGIRLGQGEAEGEAFQAFQHYIRSLAQRGVILAVCSKNTEAVAKEAFEKHPEMVLRVSDVAAFVANWDDKATNLKRIARQLEIGLDSLVFVDDNPMERALVRQLAPEVAVPELPEDPAGYIQALDRHSYFQTVAVGSEDLGRGAMYRANAERQQAEVAAGNIDDFLKSLNMKARVEPVNRENLERVAQLIARSNQFNLTTRRHSASAVMEMAESSDWITRTISLVDRFGDNGLICVLLGRIEESNLVIDTWLMSCRVLKRGVENFSQNLLCQLARERGLTGILGEYIPTPKNALVNQHYASLGFERLSGEEKQHSWWRSQPQHAEDLTNFIVEQ